MGSCAGLGRAETVGRAPRTPAIRSGRRTRATSASSTSASCGSSTPTGGPPLALCDAQDGKGGTWNADGVIVFAPSYNSPLHGSPVRWRPDAGHRARLRTRRQLTPASAVSCPTAATSCSSRARRPARRRGTSCWSARSTDRSTVLPLRSPANVEVASGHLLFARDRTLMARPFDAGDPPVHRRGVPGRGGRRHCSPPARSPASSRRRRTAFSRSSRAAAVAAPCG